jgi:hypothetical protein
MRAAMARCTGTFVNVFRFCQRLDERRTDAKAALGRGKR